MTPFPRDPRGDEDRAHDQAAQAAQDRADDHDQEMDMRDRIESGDWR